MRRQRRREVLHFLRESERGCQHPLEGLESIELFKIYLLITEQVPCVVMHFTYMMAEGAIHTDVSDPQSVNEQHPDLMGDHQVLTLHILFTSISATFFTQ
jgi:hypothetical protein